MAGYYDAAEELIRESKATPPLPIESIVLRHEVYKSILEGDIETALNRLNQINPDVN